MNTSRVLAAFAAAGLLLPVTSCGRDKHDPNASSAPPPITAAVGPIPGREVQANRPTNPYAENIAAMSDGRELFVRMNCSGCHGGRAGGGMGPSLRDEDWLYGNTDQQIFSTIVEGRAHGMPSWSKTLTNDQVWKLVAYVKSLRTPNEPQPPS
jgi:cytochrome c oxidase cbb3-type subunit III